MKEHNDSSVDRIAQLLALRDGEPFDAGQVDVAGDPAQAKMLARINALQVELNRLEDVGYEPRDWEQMARSLQRTQNATTHRVDQKVSRWLRFPLATAASVFVVSAVGIFMLFATPDRDRPAESFTQPVAVSDPGFQLATLMTRSRDLEQVLRGQGALTLSHATNTNRQPSAGPATPSRSEQSMLYRLADIDSQIALLYEADKIDTDARNRLWTQRVNVLESLVLLRGETRQITTRTRSM